MQVIRNTYDCIRIYNLDLGLPDSSTIKTAVIICTKLAIPGVDLPSTSLTYRWICGIIYIFRTNTSLGIYYDCKYITFCLGHRHAGIERIQNGCPEKSTTSDDLCLARQVLWFTRSKWKFHTKPSIVNLFLHIEVVKIFTLIYTGIVRLTEMLPHTILNINGIFLDLISILLCGFGVGFRGWGVDPIT